jgi:hypothetical protein
VSKSDHIAGIYAEKDAEIARLKHALERSVSLQSHYARLLNAYDYGERIEFKNADEWLARLDAIGDTNVATETVIVFWSEEDDGFIAVDRTRPGCNAFGKTEDEAKRELVDAQAAYDKSRSQ